MPTLLTRSLFVWTALVLFAPGALLAGEYQRARDGKTMVWNNEPKPGDEAAWSGGRDGEGYATGFGTLTWSKGKKEPVKSFGISIPLTGSTKIYARYFGNMVRGKFHGPVNVHTAGQTAHALFVDGARSSAWAPGRAPSKMPGARDAVSKQKGVPESASAVAQSTPMENSSGPEPAADKPAGTAETLPSPAPAESAKAESRKKSEEVALPQQEETPVRVGQADLTGSGMSEDAKPPSHDEPAQTPPAKKSQTDVSLFSLAGPPANLHANPPASGSPAGAKREEAPRSTEARLTKEEVLERADAEAHARGYSPSDYGRADPLYNSADEIWAVSYKPLDPTIESGKRFSVMVDDKTKGIVFVPGK
jgi:hypothetical protein